MRQLSAAAFVIATLPVLAAQQFMPLAPTTAVDPATRFEVVAIKAADSAGNARLMMTPGRFESTNLPVSLLLRQALQKPDYQIVGAPGWIDTERYSIMARAPDGVPVTVTAVMLLNLLKDRFQLTTRLETRELPVFNLVKDRRDGRLGPDLKPTPDECQAIVAERLAAAKAFAAGGPPPPLPALPGSNDPLPCGFMRVPPGVVASSGRTIAQIVPTLADLVGRPVFDRTGLTGMYDLSLRFAPTGRSAGPLATPPGPQGPAADPDAPSLFTALQEQLGLKLEPARGPVEVAVIDRLERPVIE